MRLYLDTSAVLASIKQSNEPEHANAKQILQSAPSTNELVTSSLTLTELTVAYAKHTKAPTTAVREVIDLLSITYAMEVFNHDDFLDTTTTLAFAERDLFRQLDTPSADVHHLSAAYELDAACLVTTDKKHLLNPMARERLSHYLPILSPHETRLKLRL